MTTATIMIIAGIALILRGGSASGTPLAIVTGAVLATFGLLTAVVVNLPLPTPVAMP